MRVLRLLLPLFFLMPVSILAQQPATSTPTSENSPEAMVIVDAAITALGGGTAISQLQSWSFQAQVDGAERGTINHTMNLNAAPGPTASNGTTVARGAFPSPLLPTLVAPLLLKEFKDPNYVFRYAGQTTLGSSTASVVTVWLARNRFHPAQIWYFDKTTNLPSAIDFRLPAQIGHFKSFRGLSTLSDYRSVSGVLHPFQIVTSVRGRPIPETVTLQSLTPSGGAQ